MVVVMVGVGERVIKTRTAAFVGCGVGGARDLQRPPLRPASRTQSMTKYFAHVTSAYVHCPTSKIVICHQDNRSTPESHPRIRTAFQGILRIHNPRISTSSA